MSHCPQLPMIHGTHFKQPSFVWEPPPSYTYSLASVNSENFRTAGGLTCRIKEILVWKPIPSPIILPFLFSFFSLLLLHLFIHQATVCVCVHMHEKLCAKLYRYKGLKKCGFIISLYSVFRIHRSVFRTLPSSVFRLSLQAGSCP